MDKEELHFLNTLAEFNKKLELQGLSQQAIIQNSEGIFVIFKEATLNYNLLKFDQNTKEYLQDQAEKHTLFLKVLQEHRLGRKNALHQLKNSNYTPSITSKSDIKQEIPNLVITVAFDEMYKEAAKIGKYFFEARRGEGAVEDLKPLLENVIGTTYSIYNNTKELEFTDKEWLEYLTKKK